MSNFNVGVMISRRVLRDSLGKSSCHESLELYDDWGRKEGFTPVFFTIDHIRFTDWTVNGIIRDGTGRFLWKRIPLPRLIYNRIKPLVHTPALARLQSMTGTLLFNRENRLDQWKVIRLLSQDPDLAPYLPETALASEVELARLLDVYGAVDVKLRDRSLSVETLRMERTEKAGEVVVTGSDGKKSLFPSLPAFYRPLRKRGKMSFCLIQQGVQRIKSAGCPVGVRVAVQRDGSGEWQVTGVVAEKGPPKGIFTHMAAGGTAVPFGPLMEGLFPDPDTQHQVRSQIEEAAVRTARRLSEEIAGLADLGIALVLDEKRKIWILDVNGRELRSAFRQAEEWEIWRDTFRKPMQYASYLLRTKKELGVGGTAFLTSGARSLGGKQPGSMELSVRYVAGELAADEPAYLIGKGVAGLSQLAGMEILAPDRREYLREALGQLKRLSPRWIQVENRPTFLPHVKAAFPGAKVILSLHSDRYLLSPQLSVEKRERALSACDGILTPSQFLKKRLLRWLPKWADRVEVLPPAVDVTHFLPQEHAVSQERRNQLRKRWNIGGSEHLLLFVGPWVPQAGLHHLLQALQQIRRQDSRVRLVIIGGSHDEKNLKTEYARHLIRWIKQLASAVTWIPAAPRSLVPHCYAAADLLVVPSTSREALGLVSLEGMASSLPVVSVRTGGIPEIVADGDSGILVDRMPKHLPKALAHACRSLLSNPARMKEMGRNGRKRVEEEFHRSQVFKRWNQVRTAWGERGFSESSRPDQEG